ncbi:unnamed protein product [Prunus armeniaca]
MTSNAPKREENQGFEGKIRTEEDLSSSNERAPLERRWNDGVGFDLGLLPSRWRWVIPTRLHFLPWSGFVEGQERTQEK